MLNAGEQLRRATISLLACALKEGRLLSDIFHPPLGERAVEAFSLSCSHATGTVELVRVGPQRCARGDLPRSHGPPYQDSSWFFLRLRCRVNDIHLADGDMALQEQIQHEGDHLWLPDQGGQKHMCVIR